MSYGIEDGWPPVLTVGWLGLKVSFALLVNVIFAIGVYRDASANRSSTVLIGPVGWTLATLGGGVFTIALYWTIHHSSLRQRP
jgi:hypothetical protein